MPPGFQVGMTDMLPLMGGHSWNPDQEPASTFDWVEPIWIMGPYDGGLIDYEPMIPFSFMVGQDDHEFTEALTYVGQTIDELPTSFTVTFTAATNVTTMVLKGSAAQGSCEKEIDYGTHGDHNAPDHDHEGAIAATMDDSAAGSFAATAVLLSSTASILMASFLLF